MSNWKNKELEKDWIKARKEIVLMAVIVSSICVGFICLGKFWLSFLCGSLNVLIWTTVIMMLFENYQCRRSIDR